VLEAMSYEAPVVASSAAGIPEAGGDAARYVAPDDVSGLADALYDVLRDPTISRDLRARGRARAAAMTWRATAAATLTVLESASSSLPGALPIRT
jgi:glycosyltransferase involved in cell wall biosynthesis